MTKILTAALIAVAMIAGTAQAKSRHHHHNHHHTQTRHYSHKTSSGHAFDRQAINRRALGQGGALKSNPYSRAPYNMP